MAAYRKAREAYLRSIGGEPPYLLCEDPRTRHPFHLMDEAAMALWCDATMPALRWERPMSSFAGRLSIVPSSAQHAMGSAA